MNNDLISREALKNYARKVMYEKNATNFSLLKMFDEIIDNAPTVEPKKELVPVCKVTFDKEELQKIVDEKVTQIVKDCENCPFKKGGAE